MLSAAADPPPGLVSVHRWLVPAAAAGRCRSARCSGEWLVSGTGARAGACSDVLRIDRARGTCRSPIRRVDRQIPGLRSQWRRTGRRRSCHRPPLARSLSGCRRGRRLRNSRALVRSTLEGSRVDPSCSRRRRGLLMGAADSPPATWLPPAPRSPDGTADSPPMARLPRLSPARGT